MRNNINTTNSSNASNTTGNSYNGNAIVRRGFNSSRVPSPLGLVGLTDLLPGGIDPFSYGETLLTTSPFQIMRRMQDDMDRLFSRAFPELNWPTSGKDANRATIASLTPSVDLSESRSDYRIEMELPGVPQDSIDVHVVEGMLTIRAEFQSNRNEATPQNEGDASSNTEDKEQNQQSERQYHYRERRWGRFERVFNLPVDADEENIRADFQNGVLTLTIAKKPVQEERRGRRIAIASPEMPEQEQQQIEAKQPAIAAGATKA